MKTLYQAASAVEAHMLRDLLKREGIVAHIHGEHLQGAMGELPAAGLIRLVVDEPDFDRARVLVDQWDAEQPSHTPVRPPPTRSRSLLVFLIGLTLGVVGTAAFFRSAVTVDGVDHNRDGLLDEKWVYAPSGNLLRSEADRNLDGKPDYLAYFDRRGLLDTAESDDDFNGVFETQIRFRFGSVESQVADTDGDGYRDLRSHFSNGVLSSTEYLNPSTGLPLRAEHFRLGKLLHADVDADKDGALDTRITYTPLGEVAERAAIPR
ncbi:MAG: DUF2007 domain-containing protein [Rhizobacter sp.]|nr:DUF2007 domain-containing protein [Rhizobacter sp.]